MFGSVLGLARAFPLITIVSPLLCYFLTNEVDLLLLSVTLLLNDGLNHFLKYSIVRPIMGNKKYGILGSGARPQGAKDCGLFVGCKDPLSKKESYGMPSGHSQNVMLFSTYAILTLMKGDHTDTMKKIGYVFFSSLAVGIMYSRVYLKCHTVQQVIVGGLLGLILGYIYFHKKDEIKKKLKI